MSSVASRKGKAKAASPSTIPSSVRLPSSASSSSAHSQSDDASDDSSDSGSGSSSSDESTSRQMAALLAKARQNARDRKAQLSAIDDNRDLIALDAEEDDDERMNRPLPPLDPGPLPQLDLSPPGPRKTQSSTASKAAGASAVQGVTPATYGDAVQRTASSILADAPAPPRPPPELDPKTGRKLTRAERKAQKPDTAGPAWFDLPAPPESERPRLYRETEALRLRNQLDPKRFYKRDEGEGKGIKGLPRHFAIGRIVESRGPFGADGSETSTAVARNAGGGGGKRTLVDELVDDAEARSYAKRKFGELQTTRAARGRGTLAKKKALRKQKW